MGNINTLPKPEDPEGDEPPPPPQPPEQQSQDNKQTPQTRNFTCEICVEPMLLPNKKFKNGNKCAHPFCSDCMIKYIQVKLDDNVAKIPCPALNCAQFLEPLACRRLAGPQLFLRWCDVLCESAVMALERSYCPNRNCSALIVSECGGVVKKAACPNCKRLFCFQCKLPWHAGFRCEESGELRDRNDRAFGVLVEQRKWMRCPQCHHFVELIEGCQIVKCRCCTSFCYKCGRQVHDHWCACDMATVRNGMFIRIFCVLVIASGLYFIFWDAHGHARL